VYATKQITPLDHEIAEEWIRDVPTGALHDVHGVDAVRRTQPGGWTWTVCVSAMEFIREDPLESTLRHEIASALRGVGGVVQAEEEDREVWILRGEPTGRALVDAVGAVLDRHERAIREHYDALI
jgi:hypothetical protein